MTALDLFSIVDPKIRAMLGDGAPEVVEATDHFPDTLHRVSLFYWWDRTLPPLIVVGQNPSKASRHRSDHTVTRCARRAWRLGLGGLAMLNLFPFMATHPKDLWASTRDEAMEELNLRTIRATLAEHPSASVLFAPGGDPHPDHRRRAAAVEAMLREGGRPVLCLGTTAAGLPRHPSRGGYDIKEVPWTGTFAS